MIYGYIRVSTDRQSLENQRFEITQFCEHNQLVIDGWIQETISGTQPTGKRQLGKLLRKIRSGDLIICAELSRLGRSLFMIINILNTCLEKGCRVWTVKEGYRLGDDIQAKVLAFAFGMAAEIERQLIATRTREALARKKAEGVRLGRPRGSNSRLNSLDFRADEIRSWLDQARPKADIAKELGCSRNTLYHWLRDNGLMC